MHLTILRGNVHERLEPKRGSSQGPAVSCSHKSHRRRKAGGTLRPIERRFWAVKYITAEMMRCSRARLRSRSSEGGSNRRQPEAACPGYGVAPALRPRSQDCRPGIGLSGACHHDSSIHSPARSTHSTHPSCGPRQVAPSSQATGAARQDRAQ